jgi:hypothetical protein
MKALLELSMQREKKIGLRVFMYQVRMSPLELHLALPALPADSTEPSIRRLDLPKAA